MKHTEPPNHAPWMHHAGDEPHLVRAVMRTHQAIVQAFTRAVGIPSSRLVLMHIIATCETGDLGIMEIARQLGVNAAAITRQVQDMEAAGLVSRGTDPIDKRRSPVRLTETGRASFERLHQRAHNFERNLGASVSAEDIATAVRVLAQVCAVLEAPQ
jgi:DNA-binding MarR family transcriptional regulator